VAKIKPKKPAKGVRSAKSKPKADSRQTRGMTPNRNESRQTKQIVLNRNESRQTRGIRLSNRNQSLARR
jgi:hypothetical protein